jgi:transposase
MRYAKICAMIAARRCYDSGLTVAEIAKQAKKSENTIRRWLKKF